MAIAFVLINTSIGAEKGVLEALKDISEVKEAFTVYGVYDILVRVETESMDELKEVISRRIRRLDYVRSTITMIIIG